MELQKFFYTMLFAPMTFLPENIKTDYRLQILPLLDEAMTRRKYNAYTRNFLYVTYKDIDQKITKFVKTNEDNLSTEAISFLNLLINLSKSIARFVYTTDTRLFPAVFSNLTIEELQKWSADYIKGHYTKRQAAADLVAVKPYIEKTEELWARAVKEGFIEDWKLW